MIPHWLRELVATATAADGSPPFSDQSLVELEAGSRELLGEAGVGAVVFNDDELELVVEPSARRQGHGTALLERALDRDPSPTLAWSHGDHPGARALAARFGFRATRTLLQLRTLELTAEAISGLRHDASAGGRLGPRFHNLHLESFRPGIDDEAWLELNARAFAAHPEQGALTQHDLDARTREHWFDAENFLLLFDGDELIGSNWLKVEGANGTATSIGEIYAIAVAPERQGEGLSRVLMDAGLARLRELGVTTAALYVEAENEAALALYARYGFEQHTIDVQYART